MAGSEPKDGGTLSWAALEGELAGTRVRQQGLVSQLSEARVDHETLRKQLDADLAQLSSLMQRGGAPAEKSWTDRIGAWFSKPEPEHAVEDLLRKQYERCNLNLQRAARLTDRLEQVRRDLADEIARLNTEIVRSAQGEEDLAERLLELDGDKTRLQRDLLDAASGSPAMRKLEAQLDDVSRRMAEHSVQLKLHGTRAERLARLKDHTRKLSTTIASLATDTRLYVGAASEKLDMIGNQIQAVGAAADAAGVMLELKSSIEGMTESMNEAARFVSEVQLFFHDHVDSLVSDLELYDAQTQAALEVGIELTGRDDEQRIAQGMRLANETLALQREQAAREEAPSEQEQEREQARRER